MNEEAGLGGTEPWTFRLGVGHDSILRQVTETGEVTCRFGHELADASDKGRVSSFSDAKRHLKRIKSDEPRMIMENRVLARLSGRATVIVIIARPYCSCLYCVLTALIRLKLGSKQLVLLQDGSMIA